MVPVMMANESKMSIAGLVLKNGLMDLLTKGNFLTIFSKHHNGKKHGHGKYIFADKSYYEGKFNSNIIEGKGKMVWEDGKEYEGIWKKS